MKTKALLFSALFFSAVVAHSQITPPFPIPDKIPEYDGTYENFGQAQLYYPNAGEVRFSDRDRSNAVDVVKYYTMFSEPQRFLMYNNNLSFLYAYNDVAALQAAGGAPDSLHRIDIEWERSNPSAFLAEVDTQTFARLNYFTEWFAAGGRTDVRGRAAIACQSIYSNIDMVYTSNNAGSVIYFIVYPGGNYKDIMLHIKGSKANSITGSKLRFDANWDYTTFEKPKMYQYSISGNVVTPITVCNANWVNAGADRYQINNATSYNTSLPLIIQIKQANPVSIDVPGLCWSTYFGGLQFEFLTKTHCDANNNLFVGGYSNASNLTFPQNPTVTPQTNQAGDGALAKFNNVGQLQWSTFVGGNSTDQIRDFDFQGNVVTCVGKTASSNLPCITKATATNGNDNTLGNQGWDGFIFEFEYLPIPNSFQGNWLTYLGGDNDEELNGCKFDANGNLFVVGKARLLIWRL